MSLRAAVVGLSAVLIGTGAGAEQPVPFSPGSSEGAAIVSWRCPTFHWTATEEAESVDLVVYRVRPEEAAGPPERVLTATLPGGASGWTPPSEQCLEPGGSYAWSVRSSAAGEAGDWSGTLLFRVPEAPSTTEVREALQTLERFLGESEPATRPEPRGARSLRHRTGVEGRPGRLRRSTDAAILSSDTTGAGTQAISPSALRVGVSGRMSYPGVGVYGGPEVYGGSVYAGGFFRGYWAGIIAESDYYVAAEFSGRQVGVQGLHVRAHVCCDGSRGDEHAARITNVGGDGADVLLLESSASTTPDEFTNFITFQNENEAGNFVVGEIQGDGAGGVELVGSLASPSSDFAEYLPKLEATTRFRPGDVVGLIAGKVSYRTRDADQAMVISTRPIVAAGRPEPGDASEYAKVAFLGQVPVRVTGAVTAGDLLVPSGREDGTGVALAAEELNTEQARLVIGRSLESSPGKESRTVKALVGLPQGFAVGSIDAARREIRIYRWLLGAVALTGLALTVGRRFG